MGELVARRPEPFVRVHPLRREWRAGRPWTGGYHLLYRHLEVQHQLGIHNLPWSPL